MTFIVLIFKKLAVTQYTVVHISYAEFYMNRTRSVGKTGQTSLTPTDSLAFAEKHPVETFYTNFTQIGREMRELGQKFIYVLTCDCR